MTKKNAFLYHCGRCGTFFKSSLGYSPERACTECSRTPLLGFQATTANAEILGAPTTPALAGELDPHSPPLKIATHKRRRSGLTVKIVVGWLLLLVAIIAGVGYFGQQTAKSSALRPTPLAGEVSKPNAQELALLTSAMPLCNTTLSGFLSATTLAEQTSFILSPIDTTGRFVKFYKENSLSRIDPSTLALVRSALVPLPGRFAVETQWRTPDNRLLDTVFMEENGEWRLDWDHYARYGDQPWSLFLTGSGEERGEFRLLARERNAVERKGADAVSLLLYAPRFGDTAETGRPSPEFLIKRDTKNGRLLDAAFKLERDRKRPFGVKLPNINPEDFISLRVKVRRFELEGQRRFEIEEVVACHWYSEAAPGVEITELPVK